MKTIQLVVIGVLLLSATGATILPDESNPINDIQDPIVDPTGTLPDGTDPIVLKGTVAR